MAPQRFLREFGILLFRGQDTSDRIVFKLDDFLRGGGDSFEAAGCNPCWGDGTKGKGAAFL
jgi:hypothetical protein